MAEVGDDEHLEKLFDVEDAGSQASPVVARAPRARRRPLLVAAGTAACMCAAVAVASTSVGSRRGLINTRSVIEDVLLMSTSSDAVLHPIPLSRALSCSWGLENCNATQCCNTPGMQCFEQDAWYAQCQVSCTEGPNPAHWDGKPWSCKPLGKPSAGEPPKCSFPGEDCTDSQCCTEAGAQCFKKQDGWAACKQECVPGPDLADEDPHAWLCDPLGPRAAKTQPWVEEECSPDGADCRQTSCCSNPGSVCYEQSPFWAECKETCVPGKHPDRPDDPPWSCKELGMRTPPSPEASTLLLADWVVDTCSGEYEDCSKSRCCLNMDHVCSQKDEHFAMCMETCTPGPHKDDHDDVWSCKALGPRSKGLEIKGAPSLYCWSLVRTGSYEIQIASYQLKADIGIAQCDGYQFLNTDATPVLIGTSKEGKMIESSHVDFAEITLSVDGTAGNAELFLNCWNTIFKKGDWNNYAWITKVDPDAVMVVDRMRTHLAPHKNEEMYFLNCNAFPTSPDFPMMYGSVEVMSWKAAKKLSTDMWRCMEGQKQEVKLWGEDRFTKKCLDLLGVASVPDFTMVGDGVCLGVDCSSGMAAFHPFKTLEAWQSCWNQAYSVPPSSASP